MTEPATASTRPPRPHFWRWLGMAVLALFASVLVALAALWWWAGSAQSLAAVLGQAARWLPAGQTLQLRDVQGTLRAGGRIGWLQWESETLSVQVHDLTIGWQLAPLLHRKLQVDNLHISQLQLAQKGPPSTSPATPLEGLELPIGIDLPLRIDELRWEGPPALRATALAGHYRYTPGGQHLLDLDGVDIADGHYSGHVQLDGAAPMALHTTLAGQLRVPVPQSSAALLVQLDATAEGTLATQAARLKVAAQLHSSVNGSAPQASPMQGTATAELAPWATQPVLSAQADFAALNLAPFWPGAPATLLSGQASAGPTEQGWRIAAQARNAQPGAWDKGRLPLEQLAIQAEQTGTRWDIGEATLHLGGGSMQAQGHWSPDAPWALRATVQGVHPAALHSQLDSAPISGTATATQTGDAIDFGFALQAAGAPSAPQQALRLDQASAQGQWRQATQQLDLRALRLQAGEALLTGQARAALQERSGQAQLALTLPGAQARIDGQIAPTRGAGDLRLQLDDAARTQRWLQRLPGMATLLQGQSVRGAATLDGHWQGGWQSIQQRLQGTVPRTNQDLAVQATLSATQLAWQSDSAPTLRIGKLQAKLSGSAASATLDLQGNAEWSGQQLELNTQLSGGMERTNQWRAELAHLRAQLHPADNPAGAWTLQTEAPLTATLRLPTTAATGSGPRTAPAPLEVQVNAGAATLTGPVPGTGPARISWQPLRYAQATSNTPGPLPSLPRLRTQGRVEHLPMAWANAFGNVAASLGDAGLRGDLVFGGQWDIDLGDTTPRAHAELARESGDLHLDLGNTAPQNQTLTTSGAQDRISTTAPAANTSTTATGIRQARLAFDLQGDSLQARLNWDSARMGLVEGQASIALQRSGTSWALPADAALAGQLRARLPDLGAWSLFAPPGWRVQGTLDADVQLAGTRSAPRWNGTLGADGLALRSVVDGIDLREGRLRATLAGTRMDVTEFSLHGGTGPATRISGFSGSRSTAQETAKADGGTLTGQGTVRWDAPATPDASGIRMDFNAQLQKLRVLVRNDRQLTLSGTLQAQLEQGRLALRGKLSTDRAVILLNDTGAPSLGADVVVHSAARSKASSKQQAAQSAAPTARAQTAKPPDIDIDFNLGDDFAVQGMGLTARLTGQINLRSTEGLDTPPRITGEVRVAQGQYRAYGQQLDVESGLARFSGPYDNPALDILAIRPNITQRAGVQITGTAQAPRVRLYSDPDLPDTDKLSWVMLGRSSAGSGAEAAVLQQAALALLGGQSSGGLASKLGLDDIGVKGPSSGSGTTSDANTAAALTLGKRLARNLYVTYEKSLAGTLGTLYIFYDLSRRLTLRGQTGIKSAVDLIYTLGYD
ncbi:MAG TPA: translocation/assembly module TamB domain-containing protein [Burkholderiaceae bacterium]